MGNKIGRRKQVVDEKYTRPQGLYHRKDIDHKKLRKLILESKLAPCYPGDDDYAIDLEECPICFMYYPSLNRSRCCMKSICTECFLQMKPAHASRPTQCPFCKTPNYAVEYHGVKTKEEKSIEQVEEQKVIEAQIRIRKQELQDEAEAAERMKKRQNISLSNRIISPAEVEYQDTYVPIRTQNDVFPSQASCSGPSSMRLWHTRQNRDDNFDLNLEDIMVMGAIWHSVQEQGNQATLVSSGNFLPGLSYSEECYNPHGITPVKTSPGLACAAAALAEQCQMNGETGYIISGNSETINMVTNNPPAFDMLQQENAFTAGNMRFVQNNPAGHWTEISPDEVREVVREEYSGCSDGHWSTQTEASTSYTGSDVLVDACVGITPMLEGGDMAPRHFVQENVEEHMMLAMSVSLAEARARMSNHGHCWM